MGEDRDQDDGEAAYAEDLDDGVYNFEVPDAPAGPLRFSAWVGAEWHGVVVDRAVLEQIAGDTADDSLAIGEDHARFIRELSEQLVGEDRPDGEGRYRLDLAAFDRFAPET